MYRPLRVYRGHFVVLMLRLGAECVRIPGLLSVGREARVAGQPYFFAFGNTQRLATMHTGLPRC